MSNIILAIDTAVNYCSVAIYKKKKYIPYLNNVLKNTVLKYYQ